MRREEALSANKEERGLGLTVPNGKPERVHDRDLGFSGSERVTQLVDPLPHALLFCGLSVVSASDASNCILKGIHSAFGLLNVSLHEGTETFSWLSE